LRDVPADCGNRARNSARPSTSITSRQSRTLSNRKEKRKDTRCGSALDERLSNYIIEGTRDGLIADLEKKRGEGAAPLDIVNGPLMAGMGEVGRSSTPMN